MTPRRVYLLALAAVLLTTGCSHSESHQTGPTASAAVGTAAKTTEQDVSAPMIAAERGVRSITLPHDEPELPPGPGREVFAAACVVCHSPRYITSQPPFSRQTWTEEVNKMIKTYGAHVTDEQAKQIVDYLVLINGKADEGR